MGFDREIFEEAFSAGISSAKVMCNCGRIHYNPDTCWDWEDGERERLANDPEATAWDFTIPLLEFEGATYAACCTCWHERAERISGFLDSHRIQIGEYFNLRRKILEAEAKTYPTQADGR